MKNPILVLLITAGVAFWGCEQIKVKKTKYPSGKIKEEWEVTKDEYGQYLKNGLYKAFYEDGQLHHEIHYLDDKKHGLQRSYYSNGKPQVEENYLHGKLSGRKKDWTVDGVLELEVDYVEGKQHGLFIRYRENGKPHHEIEFKNGQKHGYHKIFDEEGIPTDTNWFSQGKPSDGPPAEEAPVAEMGDDLDSLEAAQVSSGEADSAKSE